MAKSKNSNLSDAKRNKNDEFYTQWEDIEREVLLYRDHFKDKVVYLNCDDPEWSNFFKFFAHVFDWFELMKVISTHYDTEKPTYKIELTRQNFRDYANPDGSFNEEAIDRLKVPLIGNGDFRNAECIELLEEADIVVTNPPFSLFREYVAQLIEYEKKFLIIGNGNSITYKQIFPLIKDNRLWLGDTKPTNFLINNKEKFSKYCSDKNLVIHNGIEHWSVNISVGTPTYWFTNMETPKRKHLLGMYARYYDDITKYPKYDNYDAINVNKVVDIPFDYEGVIGVPITFLDKYNPDQFEILGALNSGDIEFFREVIKTGLSEKFVEDYYKQGNKGAYQIGHPFVGYYDTKGKVFIPYKRIAIKHKLKYNEHGSVIE